MNRKRPRLLLISLISLLFLVSVYSVNYYWSIGIPIQQLWINPRFDFYLIAPLLNVLTTYGMNNILSFLTAIGVFYLLLKRRRSEKEWFLVVMLIFQAPITVDAEYFQPVFLTTIVFLGGFGFQYIAQSLQDRGPALMSTIVIILLITLPFTFYINELQTNIRADRENQSGVEGFGLSQETRSASSWTDVYIPEDKLAIYNTADFNKITSRTGTMQFDDISVIAENNLEPVVTRSSPLDILLHQRSYHYGGSVEDWVGSDKIYYPQGHYQTIIMDGPDSYLVGLYRVNYCFEYQNFDPRIPYEEQSNFTYNSYPFFMEIQDSSYKTYSNEIWNIYFFKDDY